MGDKFINNPKLDALLDKTFGKFIHELKQQTRSEVIEEVKLELLKLVKGLSDPEPYVEFNDVINILTKLERGAE